MILLWYIERVPGQRDDDASQPDFAQPRRSDGDADSDARKVPEQPRVPHEGQSDFVSRLTRPQAPLGDECGDRKSVV